MKLLQKNKTARDERRSGFTLLEVVVAMFLLLVGMTTILGLLSFGAALSRTAALRNSAANAVDAVMADLEETLVPLAVVEGVETVGEPVPVERRELPGYPGLVYSAAATPNPDAPQQYRVDVDISWSSAGAKRSRSFTTLLVRQVPFGERLRWRLQSSSSQPVRSSQ